MNEEMNELREAAGLPYALTMLGEFKEVTQNIAKAANFFYEDWEELHAQHKKNGWSQLFIREMNGEVNVPEDSIIVISSELVEYFEFWGISQMMDFSKNFSNIERITIIADEQIMLVLPRSVLNTEPEDGWALEASSQVNPLILPFGVTGTLIHVTENKHQEVVAINYTVAGPPPPPAAFIKPAA